MLLWHYCTATLCAVSTDIEPPMPHAICWMHNNFPASVVKLAWHVNGIIYSVACSPVISYHRALWLYEAINKETDRLRTSIHRAILIFQEKFTSWLTAADPLPGSLTILQHQLKDSPKQYHFVVIFQLTSTSEPRYSVYNIQLACSNNSCSGNDLILSAW